MALRPDYLQVHVLMPLPASLINRGRDGEPKKILFGGAERGRISSQCLKGTCRCGDVFAREFGKPADGTHLGQRTRELGSGINRKLKEGGLSAAHAEQWTLILAAVFGVTKPEKKGTMDHLKNETLFFVTPEERRALDAYVEKIIKEQLEPPAVKGKEALEKEAAKLRPAILMRDSTAVDVALFGRMFAQDKSYSVDAALQMAHAFSVHEMEFECDDFTAMDDLKREGVTDDTRGGAHVGETMLEAGVFYVYASINVAQLRARLKDDDLVRRACRAVVESLCTIFPKAKGNSCAQQSRAVFARVERGAKAPRNLAMAYLEPVNGRGPMGPTAVKRLLDTAASLDKIYGPCVEKSAQFNVFTGEGGLDDLLDLAGDMPE